MVSALVISKVFNRYLIRPLLNTSTPVESLTPAELGNLKPFLSTNSNRLRWRGYPHKGHDIIISAVVERADGQPG